MAKSMFFLPDQKKSLRFVIVKIMMNTKHKKHGKKRFSGGKAS
jgi:hypothetical protein